MAQSKVNIALIICSTRKPRKGSGIATWVEAILRTQLSSNTSLSIIDLADWNLPISPIGASIQAHTPLPLSENPYDDPEANKWSREIRQYNGFIFLTPQYNWSFPAAIKVAIDHLFFEWKGKTAMNICYGARGGNLCNGQLRQVLGGLRMRPWDGSLELPIKPETEISNAIQSWEKDGKKDALITTFKEMVADVEAAKNEMLS